MSKAHRQLAGLLPAGFVWVEGADWVEHTRHKTHGALIRNERTGIYVLLIGGVCKSVPQEWARRQDPNKKGWRND